MCVGPVVCSVLECGGYLEVIAFVIVIFIQTVLKEEMEARR